MNHEETVRHLENVKELTQNISADKKKLSTE